MALYAPFTFPVYLMASWVALFIAFSSLVLWARLQQQRTPAVVPGEDEDAAVSSRTLRSNILKIVVKGALLVSFLCLVVFFTVSF